MGTPPEGPALGKERDTTIDATSDTGRRRRGPSMAHDRTVTPLGETSFSAVLTTPSLPRFEELQPGAMVGEYRIEGLLGEGGMGRVYSAIHPVIGKHAAVKVLHPKLSMNPEVVDRFVQEARAVNQIGHPNIVDIFSFGTLPDGQSYFVMEWLKGESLFDRVRRRPLGRDELCKYVTDISHALEAAHDKGIIHRDLKPENVYLREIKYGVEIKLLDFGIAKLASNEDNRVERTRTGAMMGTPKYIAPEQARGYTIDARADIYSLGVMVFELATGRLPFIADNAMDLVASHLHDTPPRMSTLAPDIPPILDDLVGAMLAKDAAARPSLERVRQVLEEVRALPPGDAAYTVPDLGPVAAQSVIESAPPSRGKRFALGGAIVAIGVVVGIVAVIKLRGEGEEPASKSVVAQPVPAVPPPPQKPVESIPPITIRKTRVTIAAEPEGPGVLQVDGVDMPGTSPWKLELVHGSHLVEWKPAGGPAIAKTIEVDALEIDLQLTSSPAKPPTKPPLVIKKPPLVVKKPPVVIKKPPVVTKPPAGDDDFLDPKKRPK